MPPSQVPVPEISKQFDFATKESRRLKQALEENNNFLEQKLQELAITQSKILHHPKYHLHQSLFVADQSHQDQNHEVLGKEL